MENFGLTFDMRSYQFTDEETGFVLHAEDVMMLEDGLVIDLILAGTGVKVDSFFVDVLRDTIEMNEPKFPF